MSTNDSASMPAANAAQNGQQKENTAGKRHGFGRMLLIWLAANLVVTTLLTGTLFVPGVTFAQAILWTVAGTLLGAAILTSVAVMGVRTGLSTMALTKGSFGLRGSIVPALSNVGILMGWSWVQAMLAGISLDYLVFTLTGSSHPVIFSAVCEAIVVVLAIFGHDAISRVEPLLGLVILGFMAYVFITAFGQYPLSEYLAIQPDPALGMSGLSVLDIVFATAISWTVLSADITRTARSPLAGGAGAAIGYSLSTILAMSLGIVAISYAVLNGQEATAFDPIVIIDSFGAPLAIVMFLSVMAANTMAVFGMALSFQHAFPLKKPLPFIPTTIGVGVVSVIGSTWLGLLDQFTSFLSTIGALFIPVFAVMIVDYYVVRRAQYDEDIKRHEGGKYWFHAGWNIAAVAAWLIGGITYWLLAFVWTSSIGAALPALIVSALTYFGLYRLIHRSGAQVVKE